MYDAIIRRWGLFGLVIFLFVGPSQAQVRPQGDFSLLLGIPQGDFKREVDNVGFGGNLFVGVGLSQAPVVLGVDLGFVIYGLDRRRQPFPGIPEVNIDVSTSNNIFLGHLVLRLQPAGGNVRPYFDGLFGLKYFFTESRIQDDNRGSDVIASTENFSDTALSYGLGGGVQIKLYNGPPDKDLRSLNLQLGLRYLLGSEAEYLDKGGLERGPNDTLILHTKRSRTDMLFPSLGVTLQF